MPFQDYQVPTPALQTHADQLTGAAGRGLFLIGPGQELVCIVGKTDGLTPTWTLSFSLPDPRTPGAFVTYAMPAYTTTTSATYFQQFGFPLPAGSKLLLSTTAAVGSNPTAQLITRLLAER